MKNPLYLILLLATALFIVTYDRATTQKVEEEHVAQAADNKQGNPAIECIMTRTSVRSFTPQEVKQELIDTLLRAAMAAPTARNTQPWRFIEIRERKVLYKLGKRFETMGMLKEANVAILVCGDLDVALEKDGREMWAQDASAATENLLLAAHASGLGAVWCGIYPVRERVRAFSKIFRLPYNIVPFCCVAIGYPAAPQTPKDKWNAENIHQESWTGEPALLP